MAHENIVRLTAHASFLMIRTLLSHKPEKTFPYNAAVNGCLKYDTTRASCMVSCANKTRERRLRKKRTVTYLVVFKYLPAANASTGRWTQHETTINFYSLSATRLH